MGFNVDKLTTHAIDAIAAFAKAHPDETFYAFAIDAGLLCLNSVERFEETLVYYQRKYPDSYGSSGKIRELRMCTGDWAYQGFAEFGEENGFDFEAYNEHYHIGFDNPADERLKCTEYAFAMKAVLDRLREAHAFDGLQRTLDFEVMCVEHNY